MPPVPASSRPARSGQAGSRTRSGPARSRVALSRSRAALSRSRAALSRSRSRRLLALITTVATLGAVFTATTGAPAQAEPDPTTPVRTYETEYLNAAPSGCSAPTGRAPIVSNHPAASNPPPGSNLPTHAGTRALLVSDQTSTAQIATACPVAPRLGADLEFAVHPVKVPNGYTMSLLGHWQNATGPAVPVYHLAVFADGSFKWYDGSNWTGFAPGGTVPLAQWSTIRVQVAPDDQSTATVSVNGTPVGQVRPAGTQTVRDIAGYQFASYRKETVNDDVTIDDLTVRPAVNGPLPGGTPGVELGKHTTIETGIGGVESGIVQMPHGAVAFPGDKGTEVLVTYARHRDLAEKTGTMLERSTDWGDSWKDVNETNPFPSEQSYHLTKLPGGRVIAVNYHTFMDPTSARRATVDTAMYEDRDGDGTKSWYKRSGAMTTTWDMRSIKDPQTSRPGKPLGGFNLLHNVITGPDGSLYVGGYGYYKADGTKLRQVILRSTDDGENWKLLATVAVNQNLTTHPGYEGFGEGTVQFVGEAGHMLMVMRTGSYQPMYYSRSANYGVDWSEPAMLKAGPDSLPVTGVDPMLLKTPTGKLVLNFGRPGRSLMISPDGRGDSWQSPVVIDYRNSANGAMIMTGDNQLLVFGDRGPDWANPAPVTPEVWSRRITLTP